MTSLTLSVVRICSSCCEMINLPPTTLFVVQKQSNTMQDSYLCIRLNLVLQPRFILILTHFGLVQSAKHFALPQIGTEKTKYSTYVPYGM